MEIDGRPVIDINDINVKREQKLDVLDFPPKESPFKKGSHFLNMSLSLKVLLGHIAEYLLLLSDAPSF
jgi:hypothetical protein